MSLCEITARLRQAELTAGRQPGSVRLIAVSKVQPVERVTALLGEGHRLFGENRVQEAAGKWPALTAQHPDVRLELIGPLQTNKARQAMQLFQAIHTLDRLRLAETLARLAQEFGRCPDLFVQVNTGHEPQKAGVLPGDAAELIAAARAMDLPLVGLMCIPPESEDPAPHFRMLADLARDNGLPELSMGMSGDFEAAVAAGATCVRVGSALFGQRVPPAPADRAPG